MELDVARSPKVYKCVSSTMIGSSYGFLFGFIPGVNTGFGGKNTVVLAPGGEYVVYMSIFDGVRGRE